jgi:hypothetical protein
MTPREEDRPGDATIDPAQESPHPASPTVTSRIYALPRGAGPLRVFGSGFGRRWRRFAGEILTIVLGVLIAFSLDAWWQRQQDRARELEILEALRADMEESHHALTSAVQRQAQIVDRTSMLLSASPSELSVDSIHRLVVGMFYTRPYRPVLRSYDELVNTGSFRLIRSSELRLALAEFVSKAEAAAEYKHQADTQWNDTARPFLYEKLDWERFSRQNADEASARAAILGKGDVAPRAILGDRVFRNLVIDRQGFSRSYLQQGEDLLASLAEIRRLIDLQLGR